MAYQPPTPNVIDNDLQNAPSNEAVFEALATKQPTGNYITALTGQVTATGPGSVAATIATNTVSNSNLAQVATQTFKGRTTAATGDVEDLTATQATAILNAMVGDSGSGGTKGLVPAPAAGDAAAGKYLKADGTWATAGVSAGTAEYILYTNSAGTGTEWAINGRGPSGSSYPTNSTILGRVKPVGMTAQTTVLVGVGANAGAFNDSVAIGYNAYANDRAVAIGSGASVTNNANGYQSVAIGYSATATGEGGVTIGSNASSQRNSTVMGFGASDAGNGVVIGRDASNTSQGAIVLGRTAAAASTGAIAIGYASNSGTSSATNGVIVGYNSGKSTLTGANNTVVGTASFLGASLTSAANNSILGYGSGIALTTGGSHCFVGKDSGASVTTNSNNCLVGAGCGQYMTGGSSVGVGLVALGGQSGTLLSGSFNVGLGYSAGRYISSGQGNLAVGPNAIVGQTGTPVTGSDNVGIGGNSGTYISSGSRNVGVGLQSLNGAAGTPITASGLVALGAYAGKYCSTTSNELFVDCLDRTTYAAQQTGSILYGVMSATASSQTLTTNSAFTATYGLNVSTAGYGLTVKSGSNAKIGVTSAFPGGNPNTITVSTTAVTANSIIFVSAVSFTGGLTSAPYVTAITAGTSFVITSNDNSFNGTVGWMIVERS